MWIWKGVDKRQKRKEGEIDLGLSGSGKGC